MNNLFCFGKLFFVQILFELSRETNPRHSIPRRCSIVFFKINSCTKYFAPIIREQVSQNKLNGHQKKVRRNVVSKVFNEEGSTVAIFVYLHRIQVKL